jgi:hypothetical protein
MVLSRNGRILLQVRRLALIAVGAAVAAVFLLPAAAEWLREPKTPPLPEPLGLQRPVAAGDLGVRRDQRVHNWPLAGGRRVHRSLRRSAAVDAGLNLAAAAVAGASASALGGVDDDEASDDDDESSDDEAEPSDEADEGDDADDGSELRDD